MAKLAVPPTDSRLASILHKVLDSKVLLDDSLWTLECLPLLYSRLDALHTLVRDAQVVNAHAPDKSIVDHIFHTLEQIRSHLESHFLNGAPFTIQRLSELVVDYGSSGYLLTTVVLAQKYVLALARTVMVLSKETEYLPAVESGSSDNIVDSEGTREMLDSIEKKNGLPKVGKNNHATGGIRESNRNTSDTEKGPARSKRLRTRDNRASAQDYEDFDLPINVRFVTLPWGDDGESYEEDTGEFQEESASVEEPSVNATVENVTVESNVNTTEEVPPEVSGRVADSKLPPSKKMKKSCKASLSPKSVNAESQFHNLSPLNMDGKLDDGECSPLYFDKKLLDYKVDRSERYSEEVLF